MTYDEFFNKYNGKTKGYPTDSSFNGECLSLVKLYIKECFGIDAPSSGSNSAFGYWSNFPNPLPTIFDKVENTKTLVPKKGWICIWKPTTSNSYGHIDIVADNEATTSFFNGFDQNFGGRQAHIVKHNYTNVQGFLVPKENMTSDEIAVKKSDFENLVKKSTMLDEILSKYGIADAQALYNMIAGKDSRITDLGNQLGTAQAEVTNREEQVGRLTATIANLNSNIDDLTDRLNIATGNYETAVKEKASLAIELAQTKTQLESAKQGTYTLTVRDFIKLILNGKLTISKG